MYQFFFVYSTHSLNRYFNISEVTIKDAKIIIFVVMTGTTVIKRQWAFVAALWTHI
jgi:hypothetical protein